jgi:PAS domain S-box-containing protein
MTARLAQSHRWSAMGLAVLIVAFGLTLLGLHFLSFWSLEKTIVRATEDSLRQQAQLIRLWMENASVSGANGKTYPPPLEISAANPVVREAAFVEASDFFRNKKLGLKERDMLMRGLPLLFPGERKNSMEAYVPLDAKRMLRLRFQTDSLENAQRILTRLNWFEGGALAAFVILILAVYLWYGTPFQKMLGLAETHQTEGMAGSESRGDQRAYLVKTFEMALQEMRKKADQLRIVSDDIVRSVSSGVVTLDTEGRIMRVNAPAQLILGVEGQSLSGKHFTDVITGKLQTLIFNALEARKSSAHGDIEFQGRSSPKSRVLAVSVSPMTDLENHVIGVLCTMTDLTRIRELEDGLRSKENLARLGEMTAGIAHEFRNSLASILTFAGLIEKKSGDSALVQYAREISKEARETERVVNDFLRFARPVEIEKQPVHLEQILKELERDANGVSLELRIPGDLPPVLGDSSLLKQSFLNLLRNAAEASPEAASPPVMVHAWHEGGQVHVEIEDQGCGMDGETQHKAFLPFFTTKAHGTGLGLALVQKIILGHDGGVRIESRPGQGTKVTVTLPSASSPAP